MEIFDIIKSVIFGIVEGITEWLPISSTGHMILLNEILPLRIGKNPDDFYSMFEVVIQLGAILAVVVLFWSQIWPFGRKNNKAPLAKTGVGAWVKTDIFVLWFHILVSTIPAAIIGVLFDDVFERLFYNFQTVAIMLILFGIAFIVIETRHNGKSAKIDSLVDISYTTALMIGIFQLIAAVFPGTSRSGATIVGALLIGVSRTVAAEYTFFLAIPVMFGASLLKLVKFGFHFTGEEAAIVASEEDPYENVTKINLKDMFNQNQEDYYVYFYMVQCPFCNQVKDKMLNFAAENDNVYFVDYALRENRPLQKYNWTATRSKYNKKIGYVDSDGNKVFLPGESEEKYQNMKNDYGKRMRFNFVTITPDDIPAFPGSQVGDIYTDIQTPEIDYASITNYEDMLIAGVPALYRITNGKITEFYFDSVEIEEFFNSIGR